GDGGAPVVQRVVVVQGVVGFQAEAPAADQAGQPVGVRRLRRQHQVPGRAAPVAGPRGRVGYRRERGALFEQCLEDVGVLAAARGGPALGGRMQAPEGGDLVAQGGGAHVGLGLEEEGEDLLGPYPGHVHVRVREEQLEGAVGLAAGGGGGQGDAAPPAAGL